MIIIHIRRLEDWHWIDECVIYPITNQNTLITHNQDLNLRGTQGGLIPFTSHRAYKASLLIFLQKVYQNTQLFVNNNINN